MYRVSAPLDDVRDLPKDLTSDHDGGWLRGRLVRDESDHGHVSLDEASAIVRSGRFGLRSKMFPDPWTGRVDSERLGGGWGSVESHRRQRVVYKGRVARETGVEGLKKRRGKGSLLEGMWEVRGKGSGGGR